MFKIYNDRDRLWQWDTGQRLIVSDKIPCSEVHFCNGTTDCSLTCKMYEEDGLRLVDVPNILLQEAKTIKVFAYVCDNDDHHTEITKYFFVTARPKPADYVYTETEVVTVKGFVEKALEEAKESGDFKGEKGESGVYYGNDEPGEEFDVWINPNGGEPVARGVDADGNETEYSSVSLALLDSVRVTMISDSTESVITVPSGVTLDLNGYVLTADNFTSLGNVIDGENGGNGLLRYTNGTIPNNEFLPIYDSANDGYRLYKYRFYYVGVRKVSDTKYTHAVTIDLPNLDGYRVIRDSDAGKLAVSFHYVRTTGTITNTSDLNNNVITTFANQAYTYYPDPSFTGTAVMTNTLSGLALDAYTTEVILTTGTGMVVTAEDITA